MRHPDIVQVFAQSIDAMSIDRYLVEYCARGSLASLMSGVEGK